MHRLQAAFPLSITLGGSAPPLNPENVQEAWKHSLQIPARRKHPPYYSQSAVTGWDNWDEERRKDVLNTRPPGAQKFTVMPAGPSVEQVGFRNELRLLALQHSLHLARDTIIRVAHHRNQHVHDDDDNKQHKERKHHVYGPTAAERAEYVNIKVCKNQKRQRYEPPLVHTYSPPSSIRHTVHMPVGRSA